MQIRQLKKTSLIDYPKKISAVIFTQGCNFRCDYCHNPDLLPLTSCFLIKEQEVLTFLQTRKNKLDAVVISGGEPCLQDDLIEFLKGLKSMGFQTKLDTNGSFPNKLKEVIDLTLVDYIAMDVKAPISKYKDIANTHINTDNILQSIEIIKKSGIDYEFRTTIVKSLLSFEDIYSIGKMVSGANKYYLQKFVTHTTLNPLYKKEKTYSDIEFNELKTNLEKFNLKCFIR